ncbi:MAG: hypothetical protein ABEH56_03485 [Salinirussus sp.]
MGRLRLDLPDELRPDTDREGSDAARTDAPERQFRIERWHDCWAR